MKRNENEARRGKKGPDIEIVEERGPDSGGNERRNGWGKENVRDDYFVNLMAHQNNKTVQCNSRITRIS